MRSIVFIACVCLCVTTALARTITVDDDGAAEFSDIQSAINDANDCDVIMVADGTYTGSNNMDIDFDGKLIVLRSVNGPNSTIIDCQNYGRAFYFHKSETQEAKVIGFTIKNGYVTADSGGAIYVGDSGPTIHNCILINNTAEYSGGAIVFDDALQPVVSNCTIVNNTAEKCSGGGIYAWFSDLTIKNCVIASNRAGHSGYSGYGGGLLLYASGVYDIINCTIVDNNDAMGGGGVYIFYNADVLISDSIVYGNDGVQIAEYDTAVPPIVEYSDIQAGFAGLGNIDVDPCFVDANTGDYHLKSSAGCWDPTYDSADMDGDGLVNLLDYAILAKAWQLGDANSEADLNHDEIIDTQDLLIFVAKYLADANGGWWVYDDATSRCIDAGNPGAALACEPAGIHNIRINLGAYGRTAQASGTPVQWSLLADLTNDGKIDFVDFAHMAEDWLQSGFEQFADLSRDGIVDGADISLFVENWLDTTSWH
ncbi:hypothetical protein ES707_06789 [subsurface metagenome]